MKIILGVDGIMSTKEIKIKAFYEVVDGVGVLGLQLDDKVRIGVDENSDGSNPKLYIKGGYFGNIASFLWRKI